MKLIRLYKEHLTAKGIILNLKSVFNPEGKKIFRKFGLKQYTVDNTIQVIVENQYSLSRFGDGEIAIMAKDHGVGFQEKNDQLADRLMEVFISSEPKLLVGLPDQMLNLNNCIRRTRKFWIAFLEKHESFLLNCLKKDVTYGNTNITRFYMDFKKKVEARQRFNSLKKIWEGKDILIVEGELTRSGIGNDLYNNAASVKRIICPARNAFNIYGKIFEAIKMHGDNQLILLALGPTATILAHDLAKEGYWALDLGHLDLEYMWMLANAKAKVAIPGKYVNETATNFSEEFDNELLKPYEAQVVAKILS